MNHPVINRMPRNLKGWRKGPPDHRDALFAALVDPMLPPQAGPLQWRPQIENQGNIGSCTANASTSAFELLRKKAGLPEVQFSRLGLYYSTRVLIEGANPNDDTGAYIRDAMKAMCKYGVATEANHPYTDENFAAEPSASYFAEAEQHQLTRYNACPTLSATKSMLYSGYPVVFGFSVPQSMMGAFDGYLRFPGASEGYVGGHAVYTDYYDDTREMPGEEFPGALLCVNSWGRDWGLDGTFWMGYRYVYAGIADDFFALRMSEDAATVLNKKLEADPIG